MTSAEAGFALFNKDLMSSLLLQLRPRSAHETLASGYTGELGSRVPPREDSRHYPCQDHCSCELAVSSASASTGDVSANRAVQVGCFPGQSNPLSWAVCALLSAGSSFYFPLPGLRSTGQSGFAISSRRRENCSLHNLNWQLRVSSLEGKRAAGKKKDIGRETTPPHSLNLFLLSWKRCHEHWDVPLAL